MAQGSTALRPHGMQLAFLPFKDITFATAGLTTGVSMGKVPKGSRFAFAETHVTTGFSAAGTRAMTVGTNSTTYNNIVTTVTEETASGAFHSICTSIATLTVDTEVFIKMTTTGTAAAAGAVTVVVAFFPPRELT